MSDYPMLISNKLHSFRNFYVTNVQKECQNVFINQKRTCNCACSRLEFSPLWGSQ